MKYYNVIYDAPIAENCKYGFRAKNEKEAIELAPKLITPEVKRIEEVNHVGEHIAYIWKREEE